MKINAPQTSGPFSEPLKPLVSNKERVLLEEIRLEAEPGETRRPNAKRGTRGSSTTGFTDLPVAVEKVEKPQGMVLASTEEIEVREGSPRWQFWKRPKRRDEQIAILKEGCAEMVEVMRSMKGDLEVSREERIGVKTSLSPLPVAVASLQSLSKTQEKTGQILSELKACVEQSAERENNVAYSLGSFNETMASVGRTFVGLEKRSERSIDALQKLSRRIEESDRMYQSMFDRLRESEHEFADQMGRASQRGAFAMVSACALVSMAFIFITVSLNQQKHAMQIQSLPSPVKVVNAQARATASPSASVGETAPEPKVEAAETAP
jgi:hypothetical protein